MNKCFRDECNNLTKTKFCSFSCNSKYQNSIRTSNLIDINKKRLEYYIEKYNKNPKICLFCKSKILYKSRHNKFCNHSCSASFNNQGTFRNKNRIFKVKKPIDFDKFINKFTKVKFIKCEICSKIKCRKETDLRKCCSRSCGVKYGGRLGGMKSATSQGRRSKNEIYFSELCAKKFNILTNEQMFNGWDADVIIPELKIAILWNGIWHRKKITKKHSVKQVQNRDKIKIKEIINCGYIPYIIDDDFQHNTIFVEQMFELFEDFCKNTLQDGVIGNMQGS